MTTETPTDNMTISVPAPADAVAVATPAAEANLSDHDKAMIAKARGTKTGATDSDTANTEVPASAAEDAPNDDPIVAAEDDATEGSADAGAEPTPRPDNVPEAYWDAEKGEVNMDALLAAVADKAEAEGAEGAEDAPTTEDAVAGFDFASLDMNALATEVGANGCLSEETITSLVDRGVPREIVEEHAEGVLAVATLRTNALFDSVGGKDEFAAMVAWASDGNIDANEANAFNEAMNDVRKPAAKMMAQAVHSKYKAAMGNSAKLVSGDRPAASSDVYTSPSEVTADMKDPRYKRADPAFVKHVTDKLRRSKVNMRGR